MARTQEAQGGAGLGKRESRKKRLPEVDYDKLLEQAQSFVPPTRERADRTREAAIVDALLERGASVQQAVQFCLDNGLKLSKRFVTQRKKLREQGDGTQASGVGGRPQTTPAHGGGGFQE